MFHNLNEDKSIPINEMHKYNINTATDSTFDNNTTTIYKRADGSYFAGGDDALNKAKQSYLQIHKDYYFNGIYFKTKQDLEIYLNKIYSQQIIDGTCAASNGLEVTTDNYNKELSVFDNEAMDKMIKTIEEAKMNMDSVGGIITAAAFNVPAGFGDPFYSSIESRIAQSMFAVPAVKGIDFGLGFDFVNYKASECNDAYTIKDNNNIKVVETKTNNNGGILGGISNGMPIIVNVVIKPTPSISKEQLTLNIETKEEETLIIKGRHDPCIAVRAVPVIEAALAIAILDLCIDMKGKLL